MPRAAAGAPMTRQSPARTYDALADADLVALTQGGDRHAFAAIMQRCNQRLFRIARSIVRDDAEAEDVLQEAYTRAFAAIDGFRGDSALFTWLTQITLNEARGRLRRRRPSVGLEAVEAAQERGAQLIPFPRALTPASPESETARAQTRRLMEAAIDELPEPFRLVFILRAIEECSVEETAAQLDLLPETVKTRLFRARRLLRNALSEKLASSVSEAFPFLGERCQRITEAVLARLASR